MKINRGERLSPIEQDPQVRRGNFYEVNKGFTPEMAIEEAERCL